MGINRRRTRLQPLWFPPAHYRWKYYLYLALHRLTYLFDRDFGVAFGPARALLAWHVAPLTPLSRFPPLPPSTISSNPQS
jgi:hypothetical protein